MNRLLRIVLPAVATLAVLLVAAPAPAIPRFSLRDGAPCITCHVNPSGGGMRNRYGRYVFAPTRLPLALPGSPETRAPLAADIGDTLALGGDARTAYIDRRLPVSENVRTIFQMQADLYVSAKVVPGVTLYYDQGAWGSFEAMGIFEQQLGSPYVSMYLKAGRFMPTYGLRLENHNLFVRQDIGFGPRDKDTGLELGTYLGPLLVQVAVLNGTKEERQLDDNREKALTARAEALGRVGPLRLVFGGSMYRNQTGAQTELKGTTVDSRGKQARTGVHWGAAIGRFAYLGEADIVKNTPFPENKQDTKEYKFQSYQEIDVLVVRGIDLNFNYEFREPDIDVKSGRLHRWAAGFEVYPVPYAELKFLYRRQSGSGPAVQEQVGVKEIIGMVHLFF